MSFDTWTLEEADIRLVDGDRGKNYPKQADFGSIGHCLFLSAKNVTTSGFQFTEPVFIGKKRHELLRAGTLESGDIVMTTRGTIGNVAYYDSSVDYPVIRINSGMMIFRADPSSWNARFLYYVLTSQLIQDQITNLTSGSAVPQLPARDLRKFELPKIPLSIQNKIESIIGSLADKVSVNHQINQTLEQMAQAIFKSWFVDFDPVKAKIAALEAGGSEEDALLAAMHAISGTTLFDADASAASVAEQLARLQAERPEQYAELRATAELFPSAMQDSERGEIPEGWNCLSLDAIAKYQNGLALQKFRPENEDDYLPVVKIAQLKKGYADGVEKASPNIKPGCIIDNGDVVFSWSGSLMVDTWCGGKAALNQHLFKVTSDTYPKWLYFLFTKHHLEEFQRIAADKAVTMGHIKREHLRRALCAIPGERLIGKAGNSLSPEFIE